MRRQAPWRVRIKMCMTAAEADGARMCSSWSRSDARRVEGRALPER